MTDHRNSWALWSCTCLKSEMFRQVSTQSSVAIKWFGMQAAAACPHVLYRSPAGL